MRILSQSIRDGRPIDGRFAFCVPCPEARVRNGGNRNPHIAWADLPEGTRSLALICHDPDVPSQANDVNREGRVIPAGLPRVDFFHWILVDIDPALGELPEGAFSDGVTPRGKDGPEGPLGTRQGVNSYTQFLAGNPDMAGTYYGYDGPCPPWNDAIKHHYVFTLYALKVAGTGVAGEFTGTDVREAIRGHVLAEAAITGTYSLNPEVPA